MRFWKISTLCRSFAEISGYVYLLKNRQIREKKVNNFDTFKLLHYIILKRRAGENGKGVRIHLG